MIDDVQAKWLYVIQSLHRMHRCTTIEASESGTSKISKKYNDLRDKTLAKDYVLKPFTPKKGASVESNRTQEAAYHSKKTEEQELHNKAREIMLRIEDREKALTTAKR
jgi:predicted nucleotide-binding protein (sugar kinase/HSP70/actin superfamily)